MENPTANQQRPRSRRAEIWIAILGTAVIVILLTVLISLGVREYKRTVTLGEIPDPEVFFGLSATEKTAYKDSYCQFLFETDEVTPEMLDAYAALLSSGKYPFRQIDSDEDAGTRKLVRSYAYVFDGDGDPFYNRQWEIFLKYTWFEKEEEYISVTVTSLSNFKLVSAEMYTDGESPTPETEAEAPDTQATTTQPPTTEPPATQPPETTAPAVDPSVLPDILPLDSTHTLYQGTTSSRNVVAFLTKRGDVRSVADDYLKLLLDMGYRVTDTEEKSSRYMELCRWYLTHDEVGGSTVEGSAQVCLKAMLNISYFGYEYTEISITYGSGVTYAGGTQNGSGASGSSGGGNNDTRTPCSICNRTGDCQTCGGDGYLWSSANDKENRNCYSCRNHNGKCTYCNGTGWRD